MIFVFLVPLSAMAQEASPWVYDFGLESGEVKLEWEGYWKIRTGWGTGWSTEGGVTTYPFQFPGIADGFLFSQEPDLLLTLWFLDRFYLEINFVEDYTRNTYAVGYQGKEGEPLQSVRAGNSGIGVSEYRLMEIPLPQYNTPGVSVAFATKRSDHEFMVRFDPSGERQKLFIGTSEVSEEVLFPGNTVRGRFFLLPDTGIDQPVVWIEDKFGSVTGDDGRRYRKLEPGEYGCDQSLGTLQLETSAEGRILVWYTSAGSAVGDVPIPFIVPPDSLGYPDTGAAPVLFGWAEEDVWDPDPPPGGRTYAETRQVVLNGMTALAVYDPGRFSPFERSCFYPVSGTLPENDLDLAITLRHRGDPDAVTPEGIVFSVNRQDRTVQISLEGESERSPRARYPLSEWHRNLYGPAAVTAPELCPRDLVLATRLGDTGYHLGSEVVPGSVRVTVNGVADYTVHYDSGAGVLRFSRYIYPDDRIEVTYRVEGELLDGGELFLVQGNRFRFSEKWLGELALSLRWKISADKYITEPQGSPGILTLASSVEYSGEDLTWEVGGRGILSTPDTTGYLRLAGMEGSGTGISVFREVTVNPPPLDPAQISGLDLSTIGWMESPKTDFTETLEGNQIYLHHYGWSGASVAPGEYGASAAASRKGDPFGGNVLVVTYDLLGNSFTAGDLLLSEKDGAVDCSSFTGLQFHMAGWDTSGDIAVHVLLGEIGESSDHDEDGFTEPPDWGYTVFRNVTVSLSPVDGDWTLVSILLTDEERSRLTRCRGIRILVEESSPGGAPASGRILAGGFRFTGSPFFMETLDAFGNPVPGEVVAREIDEFDLESQWPEVKEIFHFDGEDQRTAEVVWSSLAVGETWRGTRWMEPVGLSDYGKVVLYVRALAPGGEYTLNLNDADGRGVDVRFIPGTTDWEKLTIDLVKKRARLTGSGSQVLACSVDRSSGGLVRISLEGEGLSDGTLWVDELHFEEPLFSLGGELQTRLRYQYDKSLWTTDNGLSLAGNLFGDALLTAEGNTVLSEGGDSSRIFGYQAQGGIDFLLARVEGQLEGQVQESGNWIGGGHLIRFPADWRWGYVQDQYSRSYHPTEQSFSKSDLLHLAVSDTGQFTVKVESAASEGELSQNWDADTRWRIPGGVTVSGLVHWGQRGGDLADSLGSYAADWARDWALVAPADGGLRRETGHTLQTQWAGNRFDMRWEPFIRTTTDLSGSPFQEDRLGSLVEGSVHFYREDQRFLTLRSGYNRTLSAVRSTSLEGTFREDYGRLGETLNETWPLTRFCPVAEIFDPSLSDYWGDLTDDLSRAEYIPSLFVELKRPPFSRWSDLLVPGGVKGEVKRTFSRNGDTVSLRDAWRMVVTHSAHNLFGAFGVHPVFDFYNADQLISSLQFQLAAENGATPEPDLLGWQLFLMAEGARGSALTLDSQLEWQIHDPLVTETLTAAFLWKTPTREVLHIPLTSWSLKRNHYIENLEKLTLDGTFTGSGYHGDKPYRFILMVTHETRLVIDRVGSAGFWFRFGTGREEERIDTGLEFGLEITVKF